MLLQLIKRLKIIVWLLLTLHLTILYTIIISSAFSITPIAVTTAAAALADSVPTSNASEMGSSAFASAAASASSATVTPTPAKSMTKLSTSASLHNKRLHLQLQHHQYTQQQYPVSYQNYPYPPQIATEFEETFQSPQQTESMDQLPHQQKPKPNEFTTHRKMPPYVATHKGHSRGQADNNEHNNNIVDINYNSLNSHHNRLQASQSATLQRSSVLGEGSSTSSHEETFPKVPQPYFDLSMPRNITARSGQIAAINCRVDNLGDKSVSWIRKRDLHILTAGILTYTSDERFKVTRTPDRKQWALHIKYAQPRDSGIYECQVNTEPKMSMAFRLNIIVTPPDAKASISGPADLYVKIGSAITLTCHIKQPSSAHDIGPIHWYRGPYMLTPFVVHPNEAAIDMKRISMESKLGDKLQSRLRISNAQLADSGNYTCMPTTAEAASVMVNVLNDESPAAMQKSCAAGLKIHHHHHQQTPNTTTATATKYIILTLIFILIQQQLWQIKTYYHPQRQSCQRQQPDYHYHYPTATGTCVTSSSSSLSLSLHQPCSALSS